MNSEGDLTGKSFAEHQSKCIQKENYVPALNSAEVLDTPVNTDKVPQLLDKTNSLKNSQEPSGTSGSNSQLSSLTSVTSQIVHVPVEERKYLNQLSEGRQAKFFLDIMQTTGANLEEFTFIKDQGLCITVSGRPENIKKAETAIFAQFQEHISTTVCAPKEQHCSVTGKTEEKLQDMEQKTATSTQILRHNNHQNDAKIVGNKEGIQKGLHGGFYMSAEQDKHVVEKLHLENVFNPSVTRPYDRPVDKVMQEEEACKYIPLTSTSCTEITFTGKKKQLNQSVASAEEIFEDTKKRTTTATAAEKKLQHKCTTGRKSSSEQEILERTRVSEEISASERITDSETLQGEPERSSKSLTKVYSKTEDYTISSVSAPSWIHRFIIGKKGQNMSRITQNMPKVLIEFSQHDEIIIKGPTEDVNCIQEKFEAIVKDLTDRMNYEEINIDYKFHRYLIGKNGITINQIKEKNKVSVLISPENEKNNLIRIEGEIQGVQQAKKELLELVAHVDNEQSKDLIIEQRFHRKIIGQRREQIRDIRKKFPEVKINFPDPSQKSDIVQLRGPKNELEQCAKYLENVATDFIENNYFITIPILKQFHKHIIGKGGASIKKICAESNTTIHLPSASSSSENIVISGKRENCELACKRVLAIQKDRASIADVEISIPSNLHKALIHPKGCLTGSILEECGGITIHFPKYNSGLQRVVIRGPAQSVENAKKKLLQLVEENKCYAVVLEVKQQYHKFFKSEYGDSVSKICQETGARVIFPSQKDKSQDAFTITGTEEAVKNAEKELEALIKNLDDVVEDSILIDPKYHHHFTMRMSHLLKEVTEGYGGVIINFSCSRKEGNKIIIKGAKPCVEAAKRQIQKVIDDLDRQVTMECVIPQKFHHFVLGPMGSHVEKITRDYDVQIHFPDRGENPVTNIEPAVQEDEDEIGKRNTKEDDPISQKKCDAIYVTGQKEKCEAAMEALVALIPVTAEVNVPSQLYRYIIDLKGKGIRKVMDEFGVNIKVSAPGLQFSRVFITGLAANVEQAKARLQEKVVALQAEIEDQALKSFKLSFTLDPKYHPKIIGHKSLLIAKICLEHKVTVHFPGKDTSELQDQVIITGYEKNVIAAQDAIMKMVHKFEKIVTKETPLNHCVRDKIIGFHGKAINKIMDQFQVDIRFPPRGAPDPNIVIVTGLPDKVTEAIDHILSLEDHCLAADTKLDSQQECLEGVSLFNASSAASKSFAVKDSPSIASTRHEVPDINSPEEFPSLGSPIAPKTPHWGPKQ